MLLSLCCMQPCSPSYVGINNKIDVVLVFRGVCGRIFMLGCLCVALHCPVHSLFLSLFQQ